MLIRVDLNIGSARYFPDGPFRQAEARKSVKMFLVPKDVGSAVLDSSVPDFLVTDSMVARYLEIRPPQFRVATRFDLIISEIECAFVLGQHFSAVPTENSIGLHRSSCSGCFQGMTPQGWHVPPSRADATHAEHVGVNRQYALSQLASCLKRSSVLAQERVLFVLRGAAFVAVVQATELGNRDDAAIGGRSNRSRDRRVFVERKMRSGAQGVLQVGTTIVRRVALYPYRAVKLKD